MQISLSTDKARSLQTRYFDCISEQGARDFRLASLFNDVTKTVTSEGFETFAKKYFRLNDEQLEKAREMVSVRNIVSSRRVWLRLGGYRLVKLVADVTDEERRSDILNKILAPKGVVNYCEKDLQMLIKGESMPCGEVLLTESYTRTRRRNRPSSRKDTRRGYKARNRNRKPVHA